MQLIPPELREQLIANGKDREGDHFPALKFFHPVGAATWLIYAMDPDDNDYLHCLADLGMGFPELGGVLLSELQNFRGPLGLGIERDLYFQPKYPIRIYAAAARSAQRIVESGPLLEDAALEAGLPVAAKAAAADSNGHRDAVHEAAGPRLAVPGTAVRRTAVRRTAVCSTAVGSTDLPEGYDRFRDALLIVDPGACNPSGVALSLHNACRQVIAEGGNQRTDPAVRLIVTQLSFLTNSHADLDTAEYGALIEACKKKAGASTP